MSLTLVTSYINFYRTPIVDHKPRIAQLQKLVDANIPIVIFVSLDCTDALEKILIPHENVRMIPLAKSFFESSFVFLTAIQTSATKLPPNRLEPKDTFDYMCYQHSKVEFMYQASNRNPFKTKLFAWCDYDLMKHWTAYNTLNHIHQHGLPQLSHLPPTEYEPSKPVLPQDQVFFPGCWDAQKQPIHLYYCNQICWRFCGGFYLGTEAALTKMHNLYLTHFDTFLNTYETMVWDVNFWAYLEQEKDWHPIVYKADHNPSLIENFPVFAFAHKIRTQKVIEHKYPDLGTFHPSSSSCVELNGDIILNTRYVNYKYLPSGHCALAPDMKVCTQNMACYLTPSYTVDQKRVFSIVETTEMGLPEPDPEEQYQGIEDIRLYVFQNKLKFVATTVNYSGCANNRVIRGDYENVIGFRLKNVQVLEPPQSTPKEKNWIPFIPHNDKSKEYFIYSWNPFQMGVIKDNKLEITHTYDVHFPYRGAVRGSSNIVYDKHANKYVGLVHINEEHSLPKQYFHMVVWLDAETYKPVQYSKLFYFDVYGPEFCLSMKQTKEQYMFWISRYDQDPATFFVDRSTLDPIRLNI